MSGKSADGTPGRLEAQRRLGTQGRLLNLAMTGLSSAAAARLGLQAIDQQCIGLLHLAGPMTVGQLARLAGLTPSSITGVVDRLERAGLARRESDPQDRRRVLVMPLASTSMFPFALSFRSGVVAVSSGLARVPMASMTTSHSISNSEPGIGRPLRRPDSSGSPSSIR